MRPGEQNWLITFSRDGKPPITRVTDLPPVDWLTRALSMFNKKERPEIAIHFAVQISRDEAKQLSKLIVTDWTLAKR